MGFMNRIRAALSRFMSGRYGADQLGSTMLWTALILTLIGAVSGVRLLTILSDVLLIAMLLRIFSKDRLRRQNENQVFLQKTYRLRQSASEWINRVKNSRKYRYYSCPKCRMRLRVPRGVGSITITCKGCGERFDRKA